MQSLKRKTHEDQIKVTVKEKINNKWMTRTKVYPADQYNRK
ncbi:MULTISPECIES: hypothetical protein [Chryseobacterium]|nr:MULTISPECIES: hypothetical protein [Chryseobacterium]